MALIDPARVMNNLIALGVIAWVFFMIYSKMDKERLRETIQGFKRMFRRKEE